MFAIMINEKGGEAKRLEFDKPEVTIGRVQGNDIILPKGNVSKRHSRIVLKDGKFIIVDLKSTNGTYVNGRKITSPLVIKGADKVYIGDFIIAVEDQVAEAPIEAAPPQRRATMPPPPPVRRQPSAPPVADAGDDYAPAPESDPSPLGMGGEAPAEHESAQAFDEPEPPPPEPPRPEPRPRPIAPPPAVRPGPLNAPPRPAPMAPVGQPTMQAEAPILPSPARPAQREQAPTPIASATSRPTPIAAPRPIAAAPTAPQPAPPVRRPLGPNPVAAPIAAAPIRRAPVPTPAAIIAPPPPAAPLVDESARAAVSEVMRQLGARLAARLNLDQADRAQLADPQLWARAESAAQEMVDGVAESGALPSVDRDALAKDVVAESVGLGPIEELLGEEGVREISIPRHDRIFVDRDGHVTLADKWFSSPEAVAKMVDRLTGNHPAQGGLIETRLTDGTLVIAAVPPLVAHGATVTLRRPRREALHLGDLVTRGALSQGMADFLSLAVAERRNILVCGGSSSGRSTIVGALANAVHEGERVVTVEEAEELQLRHGHWVQLIAPPGDARSALYAALRLRADRLVVGDVRGGEALLVLEAAAALGGVIASLFGASALEGFTRFGALAQIGAGDGRSVRESVGKNLHVVVVVARGEGAQRRVTQIAEVTGPEQITDVFQLRSDGEGERFAATGYIPTFAGRAPSAMFRS